MSDQKTPEVGYGFDTPGHVVATIFDSILYNTSRDTITGAPDATAALKREIEPSTGLSKGVLIAKAINDLEDPYGKLIVQPYSGDGQTIAYAGKAILKVSSDQGIIERPLSCVILDSNFKGIKRKKGIFKKEETFSFSKVDGLTVLNAVVEAQALLELEGEQMLTRNEYDQLRE